MVLTPAAAGRGESSALAFLGAPTGMTTRGEGATGPPPAEVAIAARTAGECAFDADMSLKLAVTVSRLINKMQNLTWREFERE